MMAMLLGTWPFLLAQPAVDSIPATRVRDIMHVLAGDSLRGRGNGSADLLKAGEFIANEFREAGLQSLPGLYSLFHPFHPFGGPKNNVRDKLEWNGKPLQENDFLYLPVSPGMYSPRQLTDFTIVRVDSFTKDLLFRFAETDKDLLIWSLPPEKNRLKPEELSIPSGKPKGARLIVYATTPPDSLQLTAMDAYFRMVEYNIIGVLPGRSRPAECIVFSAHYDHEGTVRKGKDTIMNGANDNASGTTALLMLARYFALRNDNERTLIFCAFAGEELGLKGSTELAKLLNPEKIKAGINLEMLGVPQYGKKRVFITGERYSSLPDILSKRLKAAGLKVVREPDEEKMLFMRSDNYPFVDKGIPFHTIMASDDDDPCYHRPCDEVKRIDVPNLTAIIRAIATASRSLINGEETPGDVIKP
ncbi:MAG TPA: M28 family peptidase [Chitinophagaceae bacterium]|nr:M28 family peptidase [Chitinophagaceae bacterium]